MAQKKAWTDERDGEHWLLVCRHGESSTAVVLGFASRSEWRQVMVRSDISLDTLTDVEIRALLDRAERVYRAGG